MEGFQLICPACGKDNEAEAHFCRSCGESLTGGAPPSEPAELLAPAPSWRPGATNTGAAAIRALALGGLAFVVMLLLAQVVAFASFFDGGASAGDVGKIGGILFFAFHHAGVQMEFPTFDLSAIPGAEIAGDLGIGSIDISFLGAGALLLATFLAAFLLFRAGRRAAEEGGGTVLSHVLHGSLVALPYAALAFLVSFVISFEIEVPAEQLEGLGLGGVLDIGISPLSALLWPLAIGVLAGAAGGLAAAGPQLESDPRGVNAIAALGGGLRMLLFGLLSGFVGLLVLAGANPDVTSSYFDLVSSGREGLALLLFTVLGAPNLATAGVVVGMGGSLVFGDALGTSSVTLLSLTTFPQLNLPTLSGDALGGLTGGPAPFETGSPDPEYFVFILAPLIAVILGGRWAARRAGAVSAGQGAAIGAGAGVLFALTLLLASLLAGIAFETSFAFGGAAQTQLVRLGPALLTSSLLALAWGVIGGAAGGAMGGGAGPVRGPDTRAIGLPGRERPAVRRPVPVGAGGTGFEGLAAEQAAIGPSEMTEPQPMAQTVTEPTTPEPMPAAGPAGEGPVFEFATPATQYSAPEPEPPPVEPPPVEPPPVEPPPVEPPPVEPAPVEPPPVEPEVWTPEPEPEPLQPEATLPEPEPWTPVEPEPEPPTSEPQPESEGGADEEEEPPAPPQPG